jgi:hypothetical protein
LIFSASATELPPNFMTLRPIVTLLPEGRSFECSDHPVDGRPKEMPSLSCALVRADLHG